MADIQTTSWNLIRSATAGDATARVRFAERYEHAIRDYLNSRWKRSDLLEQADDAVQDVFVECFRDGGVLQKVEVDRPGGFRALLYGVVRNVALRYERKLGQQRDKLVPLTTGDHLRGSESTPSASFDRAWAVSILHRAVQLLAERAEKLGKAAQTRVEILRLRFNEGHPIREIVKMWNAESVQVHRQYQKARKEFKAALRDVLAGDHELSEEELERELAELADLLRKT